MFSPLHLLPLLCLLFSLYSHGSDHQAANGDRTERLDTTLTTLILALEQASSEPPDAATRQTLQTARRQRQEALALAAGGHYPEAASLLQESLIEVKIAIAALAETRQPSASATDARNGYLEKKQRDDLAHISASLEALLGALVSIGEEKERSPLVAEIRTQVAQHRQVSQALADRGALVAAREELDQALVTVKTAIAALRNRETLVRSLDFASKEEEYLYEVDRYETYGMLIRLLTEKKNLAPAAQTQIGSFQRDARVEQERARAAANAGDFEAAVKLQEISNRSLLKAIRRGGIYVPG